MWRNDLINIKWLLLYFVFSIVFGRYVPEFEAIEVARNIYIEHADLHGGDEFSMFYVESILEEGNKLIYIFHLDPTGFIMVPADNQAVPKLAFGFEHSFKSVNMPPNLNALMNQYKMELSVLIDNPADPSSKIAEKWEDYLNGYVLPDRNRDVPPLIDAEFDQGGAWNNGINDAIGFNGPVGCVAVAMCQVMHYWKHPENGVGSTYYTENDYGYIEVDFEDAFYDFDNMEATYATPASQLLLFHAGVSVNMDYDWSGSGAYVVGSYPSAFYSMENFFAYSSDISYEWKVNHSDSEYLSLIINELDNARPVISQGYGSSGDSGHAWNIDGYSGDNLHCNWGWGGSSNGYFNLTTMGGFPNDQAVIIGILPQMDNPMALFEYMVDDLTVSFIDLSEMINEIELAGWFWNFGDGSSSSSLGPVHTYEMGGSYEVSLTVMNIYGMESEPHIELVDILTNLPGDINFDSIINILDVVIMVNFILGSQTPSAAEFSVADLNNDGILNILDIVILTNFILEEM